MGFFATLAAKMTLDGSHFKAGIKEAEHSAKHFGKEVLGELKGEIATAFGAAAVIEFGYKIIENVKHIKEMSEQFQLTTDQVQEFGMAAINSGQNVEFMAKKLERMNEMRKKAGENPFGEEAAALKKIGISGDSVNGMKETSELLDEISEDAMHSSTAANDFFEVLGKGGQKMIAIIEAIRKAKGSDKSWMMDPGEIESVMEGIHKLEEIKMKATAKVGSGLAQFMGAMKLGWGIWTAPFRKDKPQSAEHGEATTGEHAGQDAGGKPSEPRYYNQAAEDQYHATQKAEADLANTLYEIEFKRADKGKQITMLQAERAKAAEEEAYWAGQASAATDKTIKGAADEEAAKAKRRQAVIDDKIFEANKVNLTVQGTDSLAHRGQLTGGSLARSSFYGNMGAASLSTSTDIRKKQLSVAERQERLLEQIARNRGNTAFFGT